MAAAVQTLQNGLLIQAFGSYAVVLQREFGWSKAMLALAYSFNRSESAVLGPAQGWALDRFDPLRVMRLGGGLLAVGLVMTSVASVPWQFWTAFFFVTVGAGLSGFLTVTTIVVRRARARRARALSIVGVGIAIGGFLNPAVVLLIQTVGWRWSLRLSAIVMAGAIWAAASIISRLHRLDDDQLEVALTDPFANEAHPQLDVPLAAALRTRAFWLVSIGHLSALLIVSTVIAHLSLFLVSERGLTLGEASIVVGAIPVFQIVGIMFVAQFGDHLDKRRLAFGAMVAHTVALLALAQISGLVVLGFFVVLHGTAWGVRGPLMQAIRADQFGVRSFGKLMGVSSIFLSLGVVGGPLFAGYAADRGGTYTPAFTALALVALVGGSAFLFIAGPGEGTPVKSAREDPTGFQPESMLRGAQRRSPEE